MLRMFVTTLALFTALPAAAEMPSTGEGATGLATYAGDALGSTDLARGTAALADGRYADAVRLLEPLATSNPGAQVQTLLGFAHLGAGEPHAASKHFARSLRLDRSNPYSRQGLGLAAIAQGQPAKAREQLNWLEAAGTRCAGSCDQADGIAAAIASLRRAIG